MVRERPKAPQIGALPKPRQRAVVGGPVLAEFSVRLKTVTPILGGSARTRTVDEVDIIRAGSIRGHLRFWWRALYGAGKTAAQLYEAEGDLWGRAAGESGRRAPVEVRVDGVKTAGISPYNIEMKSPGAYALWPAREETSTGEGPAPRYNPGLKFTLHVRCPPQSEGEVRNAVRAWILFGGYGGRTRRGAGCLTVSCPDEYNPDYDDEGTDSEWLPAVDSGTGIRAALKRLFGWDVLVPTEARAGDVPVLAGAMLLAGPAGGAVEAWYKALGWVQDFRQGRPPGMNPGYGTDYAREYGSGQRPGRSNWPEADKVRWLKQDQNTNGYPWSHVPRYGMAPAWPRASFGLPIIGRFQPKNAAGQTWASRGLFEPDGFELGWLEERADGQGKYHDRLASPLIVKALPLADGRFLPCALWLFRRYPPGRVVLRDEDETRQRDSAARFDLLAAAGDSCLFTPIHRKASVKQAFGDWLVKTQRARRSMP